MTGRTHSDVIPMIDRISQASHFSNAAVDARAPAPDSERQRVGGRRKRAPKSASSRHGRRIRLYAADGPPGASRRSNDSLNEKPAAKWNQGKNRSPTLR